LVSLNTNIYDGYIAVHFNRFAGTINWFSLYKSVLNIAKFSLSQ